MIVSAHIRECRESPVKRFKEIRLILDVRRTVLGWQLCGQRELSLQLPPCRLRGSTGGRILSLILCWLTTAHYSRLNDQTFGKKHQA